MLPLAPGGDPFSAAVSCAAASETTASGSANGGFDTAISGLNAIFVPRDFSGAGSAQAVGSKPYIASSSPISGNDASLGKFPSSVDGQLRYCRRYIYQNNAVGDQPPRADVPGVLYIPQSGVIGIINRLDTLDGSGPMAGRTLVALVGGSANMNVTPGAVTLVDITGPWR